jgi:hypothetical protein
MNKQEEAVTEEFWLALARNDRKGARAVADHLDLPQVESSAFSFEEVEGEGAQEPRPVPPAGLGGETGTLSPKALNADTPVATVEAWNGTDRVALRVVSSAEICGAQMADREVDFLACAGPLERPGALTCSWLTHATGGKDAKMRPVLKMKLPADGSKVYAIPVKSLGSGVKRPKIFSLPTLPFADLPYDVLTEGWDEALRTLKLRPRDWKFFIEVYRGASWLVELWLGTKSSAAGDNTL